MTHARQEFLSFDFDTMTLDQARQWIVARLGSGDFAYVVTPNVDHVVQVHNANSETIEEAYQQADLVLCDSRILARLARWSGISLPVVPGSDLTRELLAADLPSITIAVIGGDTALHRRIGELYDRFEWKFLQPPMGVRHSPALQDAIANFVVETAADVVLFAIGAPQSELTCARIKRRGGARGVALCIGASLEFLVGAKRRAPRIMQRTGLEWLFRLVSEPHRLWRRYLVEGPKIFAIWARWRRVKASRPRDGCDSSRSADE